MPSFHSTSSTVWILQVFGRCQRSGAWRGDFNSARSPPERACSGRSTPAMNPFATPFSPIMTYAAPTGRASSMRARNPVSSQIDPVIYIIKNPNLQQAYNHSAQPSLAGAQAEAGEGTQSSGRDRTILYVQFVIKESDNRATWLIIRGA